MKIDIYVFQTEFECDAHKQYEKFGRKKAQLQSVSKNIIKIQNINNQHTNRAISHAYY